MNPISPDEVVQRYYLDTRAKILDVAAALDRIDRSLAALPGKNRENAHASLRPRIELLRQAIAILAESKSMDRAERIQMVFSLPFDPGWRSGGTA